MNNTSITTLPVLITIVICFLCGISDYRTRKIPNVITLPSIILGFILNTVLSFYYGFGWSGLLSSILGFAIGFGFFLIFYLISHGKGMGAGDVKLFGAIGALLGYKMTIYALFATAITGLVIAVILFFPVFYALLRTANLSVLTSYRNKPVPYGVAIAIGTILVSILFLFQWIHMGTYF